jgi:hypothetical protein
VFLLAKFALENVEMTHRSSCSPYLDIRKLAGIPARLVKVRFFAILAACSGPFFKASATLRLEKHKRRTAFHTGLQSGAVERDTITMGRVENWVRA